MSTDRIIDVKAKKRQEWWFDYPLKDVLFTRQGEAAIVYSFEQEKGTDGRVKNVLRAISQLDHLILAFETIKSNPGNMTPGIQEETMEGFKREDLSKASATNGGI